MCVWRQNIFDYKCVIIIIIIFVIDFENNPATTNLFIGMIHLSNSNGVAILVQSDNYSTYLKYFYVYLPTNRILIEGYTTI